MDFKELVVKALVPVLDGQLDEAAITALVETPKSSDLGDFAFPTFSLAKIFHQAPKMIASDLVAKIDASPFEQVKAVGGYVNFYLDKISFAHEVLKAIAQSGEHFGDAKLGEGNVPIDMSSPNIAKPMSMGHLRSTVIGNALANILQKVGYSPIKINHLGDWGTQFGKLIVAYKNGGRKPMLRLIRLKTCCNITLNSMKWLKPIPSWKMKRGHGLSDWKMATKRQSRYGDGSGRFHWRSLTGSIKFLALILIHITARRFTTTRWTGWLKPWKISIC